MPTTPRPHDVKPRVLFVNTRSALGADVAVHLTLIQHLDPDRVDVFVATNRHSKDLEATVRAIRVAPAARLTICDLGREVYGSSTAGRAINTLRNLPALVTLLRLAALVRRERIHVLHTTDRPRDAAFTTLLGLMTGAAVVLHIHVKWTATIGRAAQWAAGRARALIGISTFTCQSLRDGGVDPERIFLAHNATDTRRFDPAITAQGTLRARLGLDANVPLVGIVGRFTVWKGHLDLVSAFAQVRAAMPTARLVLVGRATDEDASMPEGYVATIRRRIRELDLEQGVSWVDWMDDVPAVMADLDVMAMPSFEEPFGLVVTECLAMERPVVGYASGALPEIVIDGVHGRLVPPGNIEALASALVELLRDPVRRAAMGVDGRKRVIREFSPVSQAATVTRLYDALARGEAVPVPASARPA